MKLGAYLTTPNTTHTQTNTHPHTPTPTQNTHTQELRIKERLNVKNRPTKQTKEMMRNVTRIN